MKTHRSSEVLFFVAILFYSSFSMAAPTITWTPSSVSKVVSPGTSTTTSVSFVSSENIDKADIRVVRKLAPYVTVSPKSYVNIIKGHTNDLSLTISAPPDAPLNTFDGTIQLRNGNRPNNNFSKPLPVVINIEAIGPEVVDIPVNTNPTAFFTNSSTQVRFQARILPSLTADPSSAQLYEVDNNLNPVGNSLCNLLDNGELANGDDIAGDSVFSCFATFLEAAPKKISLAVQITVLGQPASSPVFFLDVVNPLTQEEAQAIVAIQLEANQIWQSNLALFGDTLEARNETASTIKTLPGVADAGVSIDEFTIWIKYTSGINGGLMLNPPGTRGGSHVPLGVRQSIAPEVPKEFISPPASFPHTEQQSNESFKFALAAVEPTPVENTRVLVWDAYNSQFAPFDEGPQLQQLFQNAQCPKFNVTYLIDGQATVDSVKTFTQYGTVILVTHGAVDGDNQVVFLTRENANLLSILGHAIDLLFGRISVMGDVFAIRPSFISSLSGNFQKSIVYNGSCQSSANATMSNAFTGKGAKTYYGYTRVVNSDFAQNVANQLFDNLVTNLDTTGDSFNPVSPKVDPTQPFATFTQVGDVNVAYTGDLKNISFESGDLTSWTPIGDGRVLATLGPFQPTDGTFMGIISTGLGFTTSSGSIEQNFCLPETATKVEFDWNYNSEEFIEWCGAQHPFDDPFEVELVTEGGTSTLFSRTVDSLCGSVISTTLAFDQSGPGCSPSPGVGIGTGGNDCTVWSSGWAGASIDVSGIATGNDGKGVTLRFKNFDTGDSIFDSAVLLDNIKVVVP